MNVLVLGGTGAMGVHLVELLTNNGIETVVTSRKYKSSESHVKYIQGNAQDIDFLKYILQNHWDAIIDFMIYDTTSFSKRVNLLLNSTSQYILLSSARVYAESDQPITEESPRLLDVSQDEEYLNTDEYALTKARQENILLNTGRKNWTIIRPYITYSKNRLQLGTLEKEEWLYRALHGRAIILPEKMLTKSTTMTYGMDVAKGIFNIIGKTETFSKTYHITTNESIIWQDVLNIYLKVIQNYTKLTPKVKYINQNDFLECKSEKYQLIYDRHYNRIFDNTNISNLIDVNNFLSPKYGLKKHLEDFLKDQSFNNINWINEAKKDILTNEKTRLKEIPRLIDRVRYLIVRYKIKK